jgi:hypothetical protein
MIRNLKTVFVVNMVVMLVVIAVYITYGLFTGLSFEQQFLGVGPARPGRGSSQAIPPLVSVLVAESVLLLTFIIGRQAGWNMVTHRNACGIVGAIGCICLFGSLFVHYPSFAPRAAIAMVSPLDYIVGGYVWCSHIAFKFVNTNDA